MKRKIINHYKHDAVNAVTFVRKKDFARMYFSASLGLDINSYLKSVDEFNIIIEQSNFNRDLPALKVVINKVLAHHKLIVLVIKINDIKDFLSFLKEINHYLKLSISQYVLLFGPLDTKMQFILKKYLSNIINKFLSQDNLVYLNKKINLNSLLLYEFDNYLNETLYLVLPRSDINLLEKPSVADNIMLLVRSICSKKCIFCSRQTYSLTKEPAKYESGVIQLLQQLIYYKNLGISTLSIGGDEPLTYSKFNLLIKLTYFLGFRGITLLTSMIRLEKDDVEFFVRMGITTFNLPLYGHNSKLHDSITREKNSFNNLINFLNIVKNYSAIKIAFHVIILKQNYKYINKILDFCKKNNFDCNLQVVMPFSDNYKDYKKVAVRYSDLVRLDMPAAFIPKCIDKNKNTYIKDEKIFKVSDWREGGKNLIFAEDRTGKSKNISEKNYEVLTKAKKCKKCIYFNECSGVFYQYLQCFGDKELRPILK